MFTQTIPLTAFIALIGVVMTALLSIRSLRQQRRLSYLQSILQVSSNRVRLQSILASARFLVAINRLFPSGTISKETVDRVGEKKSDLYDVLAITIYTRERLFRLKIRRDKHNEQMEPYESYIYDSNWIGAWRSDSLLQDFKHFIGSVNKDGTSGEASFVKFVFYVKRFISWCVLEPQFDMIFSVSPRIQSRLLHIAREAENFKSFDGWLEFERLIFRFYQGKGW